MRVNPCRSVAGCWRPWLLAVAVCLAGFGCAVAPDALPDSFQPARIISTSPGSKAEAKAFNERVRNDPFPTASMVQGHDFETAQSSAK
ncbi:MAG: hypothetical protein JXB62_23795 [Pirellulales bacterium]|nr:hypothetical protein [Pirellulales bacterium]